MRRNFTNERDYLNTVEQDRCAPPCCLNPPRPKPPPKPDTGFDCTCRTENCKVKFSTDLSICVALSDFAYPYSAQNLGRQIAVVRKVRFSSMPNISLIFNKKIPPSLCQTAISNAINLALFFVRVITPRLIAEAYTDL